MNKELRIVSEDSQQLSPKLDFSTPLCLSVSLSLHQNEELNIWGSGQSSLECVCVEESSVSCGVVMF